MPIKVFEKDAAEGTSSFEKRVNVWLAKLDEGSIRNISTVTGQSNGMLVLVTVWYEGLPPPN